MSRSHRILLILFAGLLCVPGILFCPCGLDVFTTSLWAQHFAGALWSGVLYPRWLPDMFTGFGSPVFFYYPPLVFYLTAPFYLLRHAQALGYLPMLLSVFFGLIISGHSCYHWLMRETQAKRASFLGALFYMSLPFHLAHSWYGLTLLAQFWAYAWFPLLLLSARHLRDRGSHRVLWFALSLAVLLYTNLPNFILFAPVAVLYALIPTPQSERMRVFTELLLSIALGLLVGAAYWVPALLYQDYSLVNLQWKRNGEANYVNQLIPLRWDFLRDHWLDSEEIHLTLTLLLLFFSWSAAYRVLSARRNFLGRTQELGMFSLLVMGFLAWFMHFKPSAWIWKTVPLIPVIQMPSRFLAITALAIILFLSHAMAPSAARRMRFFVGFFILLFTVNSFVFAGLRRIDLSPSLQQASTELRINIEGNLERYFYAVDQFYSYLVLPHAMVTFYTPELFKPIQAHHPPVEVESGDAQVSIEEWKSREITLSISATTESRVVVRQFYFPGWVAESEQGLLAVELAPKTGSMVLVIPPAFGTQRVTLQLYPLLPELIGNLLSLFALAVCGVMVLRRRNVETITAS